MTTIWPEARQRVVYSISYNYLRNKNSQNDF